MKALWLFLRLATVALVALPAMAKISVIDDTGATVTLSSPASHIISLAPHLTELVYSVGSGDKLVGVVSHSDYPPEALKVPLVGSYEKVDYEAILAARPDLVLVWQSGNGVETLQRLKDLGLTLYINEPRKLPDIAASLRNIGMITGQAEHGEAAAAEFLSRYHALKQTHESSAPVRVFYELWYQPMMTINGEHIIANAIELCGGVNIFDDAIPLIPKINVESVLRRNPDAIVASGMGKERPEWLDDWKRWPDLTAVRIDALYSVHPDLLHRHTMRILSGVEALCSHLQDARKNLQT